MEQKRPLKDATNIKKNVANSKWRHTKMVVHVPDS